MFFGIAKSIISREINEENKKKKEKHLEFIKNPINEMKESIKILKAKSIWKERYEEFVKTMVYNSEFVPNYEIALQNLESLGEEVFNFVNLEVS